MSFEFPSIVLCCSPDPNVLIRILAGCTTGAMAVSFAQPTDVVKVRFQAQMNLSGVARRYNGTMQAYKQIFQNEGMRGLWKGATSVLNVITDHNPKMSLTHICLPGTLPNITRNALVNCTELVTYDLIKEAILRHRLLSGECLQHEFTANEEGGQLSAHHESSTFSLNNSCYDNTIIHHLKDCQVGFIKTF